MPEQESEQQASIPESAAQAAEGLRSRLADTVAQARGSVDLYRPRSAFEDATDLIEQFVREHPVAALLVSGLLGFVLGRGSIRQFGTGHLPGKQTTPPPTDD